jgi:hypothetical protein
VKNGILWPRFHTTAYIILTLVGLANCALSDEAVYQPEFDYLEYTVYVDALNLRAEPSLKADVLAVLPAGAVVKTNSYHPTGEVEENLPIYLPRSEIVGGIYWTKVRAGDIYGWVAEEYIMPRPLYDAYREADRLGKAGDAAGMLAAIKAAEPATYGTAVPSPDGRKVVVSAITDYEYNPFFGADYSLYFETGKGLGLFGRQLTTEGLWTPDSRYYASVKPWGYIEGGFFLLFDAETYEQKGLGDTNDAAPMEYLKGYFVWLTFQYVSSYENEIPELTAYELASGETTVLLKADAASLREGEYGREELQLVPAGPLPAALEGSLLYEEFNGAYVATVPPGP